MAFKIFFFFHLILLFSLLAHSSSTHRHHHQHHRRRRHHYRHKDTPATEPGTSAIFSSTSGIKAASFGIDTSVAIQYFPIVVGGEWTLLHQSIGISTMHMQLLYNNKVVMFDRTDFGFSNLSLPAGQCRVNDEVVNPDCTAHSVLYDVATNTYRPLFVRTDVWCSSGAVMPNGTLIQTGGYHGGDHKIRLFLPCDGVGAECDWVELPQNLTVQRWYASNQILPDGRIIIVGGRRAFNYEFFPKNSPNDGVHHLPFLVQTSDPGEENNLYPFLHLLPDGNLYIFANQRSILFDYVNHRVVREFPAIPGEKRNYPSTGSSVLLPLRITGGIERPLPEAEVMVCGGAPAGAFPKAATGNYVAASKTCGRLRVSDPEPEWIMEEMPLRRVMPDMLFLPTGHIIILNGAARGTAGWEDAVDPVLNPVLYNPDDPNPESRFTVLNPTRIPRMYHSSATLLPDGRILVGGSNPHTNYNFTTEYPTDLSLEVFSPHYLAPQFVHLRPSILSVQTDGGVISYGANFSITFTVGSVGLDPRITVTMIAPSFTTHSFAMNQRLLKLDALEVQQLSEFANKVTVHAPPTRNVAPPGYYMLFVIQGGIPGHCVWVDLH